MRNVTSAEKGAVDAAEICNELTKMQAWGGLSHMACCRSALAPQCGRWASPDCWGPWHRHLPRASLGTAATQTGPRNAWQVLGWDTCTQAHAHPAGICELRGAKPRTEPCWLHKPQKWWNYCHIMRSDPVLVLHPVWGRSPDCFSRALWKFPEVSVLSEGQVISHLPLVLSLAAGPLSVATSTVTYTLWLFLNKSFQEESCSQLSIWFPYIASGISSSCRNIHAEDLHVKLKLRQKRSSTNTPDICLSVVPCLEPEAESWGTAVLAERDPVLRGERFPPSSGTIPISNYAHGNKFTFYFLFSFFLTSACNP